MADEISDQVTTAVVVVGGERVPEAALDELPQTRWVVAADSGLDHARRIGLHVDLLVGDMDSVDPELLAGFEGLTDMHHPAKDATDIELALATVHDHAGFERVIVVGGHGGRLDHLLANAQILSGPALAGVEVEWIAGRARVHVIRDHCELHGAVGELVSLLPVGRDARGVTTSGLRWELDDDTLTFGSGRGISNVFEKPVANVRVTEGCLLSIQPSAF